jgi:hypothetical protein
MNNPSQKGNHVQLISSILIISVILTGISGKINLGFANVGRLIIFLLGILFISAFIEKNHNLTLIIDDNLLSKPGMRHKQTENFRMISIIMLSSGIMMLLIGSYFLGQRNYTLFTSFTCISFWIIGMLVGRTINGSNIEGKRGSEWRYLKDEEKKSHFSQLKAWLDGSSNSTISSIQQDKIIKQREIFNEIIVKQINQIKPFKDTISILEEAEDILERLYVVVLKPAYIDWLNSVESYIDKGNMKKSNMLELIKRLLTINVLDILLEELSRPKWENTRLFLQILEERFKSERYLSGHNLVSDSQDNRISPYSSDNKLSEQNENMGSFVRFVSWQAMQWDEYQFSSGWLNFLKAQYLIIINQEIYSELNSDHPLIKYIQEIKNNYQEWCFMISEVFSNKPVPESSIIAKKIINEIRLMDTGHFSLDLVVLTYWAHDKLV